MALIHDKRIGSFQRHRGCEADGWSWQSAMLLQSVPTVTTDWDSINLFFNHYFHIPLHFYAAFIKPVQDIELLVKWLNFCTFLYQTVVQLRAYKKKMADFPAFSALSTHRLSTTCVNWYCSTCGSTRLYKFTVFFFYSFFFGKQSTYFDLNFLDTPKRVASVLHYQNITSEIKGYFR